MSNILRAQKNAEDESCQIALSNLRSEVIRLRNEATEKDKILLFLVDRVKASEANLVAQSETHKSEIEDLKEKLAEKNEDFEVAKAKQEISEWTGARLQKNVDELRESKGRYYKKSLDCAKKLKDSFAKVGAYSSEQKFIRGDPEGIIEWIGEEAEAFEEIPATVVIFALLLVPEGLQQFWKNLAMNMLKLQPRRRLSSLWRT
jgi:chromosome segregation ATPase